MFVGLHPSRSPRATQHRISTCVRSAPESRPRSTICAHFAVPTGPLLGGDRRGSNLRPSEPQHADTCFCVLPKVAQSAYLDGFLCSRLPTVSVCCALSGVRGGVNSSGIRHG